MIQDFARSDQTLRDLVGEVKKLGEKEKEWEEEREERQNQEKAREEREKKSLNALVLLAKRTDEVKNDVTGIARLVGVGKGMRYGEGSSMVERLEIVDMNVEEWLERHRDQDAGKCFSYRFEKEILTVNATAGHLSAIESQGLDSMQTSSQTMPSVVRHEMGISPIRRRHTNQAVSTRTTSTANPASKIYVSVQGSSPITLSKLA